MQHQPTRWNISAWSIRTPIPTIVLFLVLLVAGVISFITLGIDENPNIDVPVVSVTVNEVGAAPSELETEVTRKIEDSIATIGNIKHITSIVNEGSSLTEIEFVLGTNTDRAVNDVRNAVSKIRQKLPQGIDEPIVERLDFVGGPFVTYTISSDTMTEAEISWILDNDISRALLSVPGVGQVMRSGGVDREVRVNLNPTALEAMGVTADAVNSQIRALNINLPGGRMEVGTGEESVRTLGSALTVADLAATRIALPNGHFARLDTLGTISDGTSDQRQMATVDGKSVVSFSIVRSTGSNLADVEKGVDDKLNQMKKTFPPDLRLKKIFTTAEFVRESYHASMDALVIGALLAVVVIWLFLRDWRATLISALAMPLSAIPTFAVMKWSGFTLNNMSLLGLALVIGILVDDAIVEIENIVRHLKMGKTPFQAAIDASDEIGLAVIATTMTIVVTFVPVAFMGGIPGQFFKQFGLTVAVAVFFSLMVARMVTPMMAAYWMKPIEPQHGGKLADLYNKVLDWALTYRAKTIGLAVLVFVLSLFPILLLPTSLIGDVDRGKVLLEVELQPGARIDDTRRVVDRLTGIIKARPETDSVFAMIGGNSTAGPSGVNAAKLFISLKPRGERRLTQKQFEDTLRPELLKVPGARLGFSRAAGMPGKPLKLLLTGNDPETLSQAAEGLTDQMRMIHGLSDVTSSASLLRPEILVKPDFALAAEQGVSVQAIARTALIATLGDTDYNLPKFNLKDRQINIRVQINPVWRNDVDIIRNLKVSGKNGRLVPLRNVAQIEMGSGAATINRFDRSRQVAIEASLEGGMTLGQAMQQIHKLSAYKALPRGVMEQPSGDAEIQRDVFDGFGGAIGAAVLFIYAVLVLLFEGFLQPMTIMMSLPLALGGALIGLFVTGKALGMYALIGIVMLMGLVTKNAILLVEYSIMMMKSGMPRRQAIFSAGEARMPPILMTTVAMIAGMFPIALGLGAGSEARAPMAVAVIGGLLTSTVLTLVVVPVVFSYVDDLSGWLRRRFKKNAGKDELAHQVAELEQVFTEK
jgi:hydrophobe/amphiphile efflux-1 (HAE1) family protein